MNSRRYRSIALMVAVLISALPLAAQSAADPALPAGDVVIERAPIPQTVHRDRELVLWMLSPVTHDRGPLSESNPYTYPESTLGSYYSGPTRVSLFDSAAKTIVNTIKLTYGQTTEDSSDIPYRIVAGRYYLVPGHNDGTEGKPALLSLRDFNGDGLPLETPFLQAVACMGLNTTLIGYSPRQDKVIQYQVELLITERKIVEGRGIVHAGPPRTETSVWVDNLFSTKPDRPGHFSYMIDYTGRGGAQDSYNIHFDRSLEKFVGTLHKLVPPWGAN